MSRTLTTLLVLALLGGTAAAFAVTERLKLVPSPIIAPEVTEAFAPGCDCPTRAATVRFRLREDDRLTVSIVDEETKTVETLVQRERHGAGPVSFTWDGKGAEEGVYRARVQLLDARRTIVIPNAMRVDTTAPTLTVESIEPTTFSPDGDGRADFVRTRFAVSERSHVSVLVDGEPAVRTPPRVQGKVEWYGKGEPVGLHELAVVADDLAGNRSQPTLAVVRLRFVALAPRRVVVPAGVRFGVRVSTDALAYRWRLGARRGSSGRELLVLRAPQRAGRFTLTVSHRGHDDAIPVFVRARSLARSIGR
jgi:hypothetical protein